MSRASKGALRARRTDEHIRIDDEGQPVRVVDVHQRYGGLDVGASLAGALAALGVTVLLGGLAGAIGTVGYQLDLERRSESLSAGGLAVGLVVLIVAFLIGGWVAGRMARYDGGRNGLMTAVWFIVLAAVLAIAGAWLGDKYDVFANLELPQWFDDNATTGTAIISGAVAAAFMLAAGFVGGLLGARYHSRADAYLAAEQRDRITGNEPLETVDANGHRVVTGRGPALATTVASGHEPVPPTSPSESDPRVDQSGDDGPLDLRDDTTSTDEPTQERSSGHRWIRR